LVTRVAWALRNEGAENLLMEISDSTGTSGLLVMQKFWQSLLCLRRGVMAKFVLPSCEGLVE